MMQGKGFNFFSQRKQLGFKTDIEPPSSPLILYTNSVTFTQNLLNLELCIFFLTPYLFCCFCYQYCFKYWNFTLLTHLFLQKHQMNASVVEMEKAQLNEELETTYKLNSKGTSMPIVSVYGLSGIVLQISPAYLLACSCFLEWGVH